MKVVAVLMAVMLQLIAFNGVICAATWHEKATFEAPSGWKLLKANSTDKAVTRLFLLRKDRIGGKMHPSNALFQYYPVPSGVTIAEADGIIAAHTRGAAPVLQARDDPNWRTYLLVYKERGQQYAILHRIGIVDGIGAELMLSFPLVPGKKDDVLAMLTLNEEYVGQENMAGIYFNGSVVPELVNSFNSACKSLKIQQMGQYQATAVIMKPPAKPSAIYRYKGDGAEGK